MHAGRLLVVLIGAGMLAGCGNRPAADLDPAAGRWKLDAWVIMSQDSTGVARPTVIASVPHRQLVFKREEEAYTAGLEVRVVASRNKTLAGGGVGRGTVSLKHHAATGSRVPLEVAAPLLVRGGGPVVLEVTAQALGTTRTWWRQLAYDPRAYASMPLWISDLRTNLDPATDGWLVTSADADSIQLTAILKRNAGMPGWPDGGIDLVSEVDGPSLTQPRRIRTQVPARADTTVAWTLRHTWPADRLPFGRLQIRIMLEANTDGHRWQLPREPALSVVNLRISLDQDRDWHRHLAWLDSHLHAAVRDSMKNLAAQQRREAWATVWQRIAAAEGISPSAAERRHLERIVAADDRFVGQGRGSLSDRGRVFIRWGEPARIEIYPDENSPGALFEVWIHPEAGMRFVFYDAHGLGDFRLLQAGSLAR